MQMLMVIMDYVETNSIAVCVEIVLMAVSEPHDMRLTIKITQCSGYIHNYHHGVYYH